MRAKTLKIKCPCCYTEQPANVQKLKSGAQYMICGVKYCGYLITEPQFEDVTIKPAIKFPADLKKISLTSIHIVL